MSDLRKKLAKLADRWEREAALHPSEMAAIEIHECSLALRSALDAAPVEPAPAAPVEGSEEPEPGGCSRCGLHRDRAIHWNRESPLFHEFSPAGRSPGPAPRGAP